VIALRQQVRLLAPEPASERRANTGGSVSVRIGETFGTIVSMKRGFAGEINRVRMVAPKLSTANVGSIAINDAGQTVGIVTGIEGNEAVMLPPLAIRSAAQRVLARKGSVPRPWLGVSGESVALTPFEGIVEQGWRPDLARLLKSQSGIMVTSITPGSPAEMIALHAGDVIVRVNNSEVKSAEDFSLLLDDAAASPVLLTIVRPNHPEPESVSVMLSEAADSRLNLKLLPGLGPHALAGGPLVQQGIETMPMRTATAMRPNAAGGLFVLFVQSESPAFKAGLRPTDVIQAINGQPLINSDSLPPQALTGSSYSLTIIRDKQKLVLNVEASIP